MYLKKEVKENVLKNIIKEVEYLKKFKSISKELNDKQINYMCCIV